MKKLFAYDYLFLSLALLLSGCEKDEIEKVENEENQNFPVIFFSKPLVQGEVVILDYKIQNVDSVFCNDNFVSPVNTLSFMKCDTTLNFKIVKNGISTFKEIKISKALLPEIQIRDFDSLYPAGGTAHVFFTSTNVTKVKCEGKEYATMGTFVFDISQTEEFEIELVGSTANSKVKLTVPVRTLTEKDEMKCQSKWDLTLLDGAPTLEGPWHNWDLTPWALQIGIEFYLDGTAKLFDGDYTNGRLTTWDEIYSGGVIEQSLNWDTLVIIQPSIRIGDDGTVYNEFSRQTYTHI